MNQRSKQNIIEEKGTREWLYEGLINLFKTELERVGLNQKRKGADDRDLKLGGTRKPIGQ